MESIAALVSGGVDSSVVVHLLCEQGTKPDIFYIRIGMEDEEGYIDCPGAPRPDAQPGRDVQQAD